MHYGSRNICNTRFYDYIYHCILSLPKSRWVMWINPKDNPGDPEIANENTSQWVITIEYVCACSHTSLNNKKDASVSCNTMQRYRFCKPIHNGKICKINYIKKLCTKSPQHYHFDHIWTHNAATYFSATNVRLCFVQTKVGKQEKGFVCAFNRLYKRK